MTISRSEVNSNTELAILVILREPNLELCDDLEGWNVGWRILT